MKHYFFCAFLSLFLLSGCGGSSGGGGGSSTSSSKKAKAAKACTTPLPNGKGQLPWNKTTKKYNTTCEVVSCDAGFDSVADSAQCQSTPSGFFSLANDKTQTACPTPSNSSAIASTGLSSASGCYTCNSGYLKNTARNTCNIPATGKYVNSSGSEKSCNRPTGGGFKTFSTNTGGVATATGCDFSCKSGFVKNTTTFTCSAPDTGKYANNLGVATNCNAITRERGGFNTFLPNTGAVSSGRGCDFSCNVGFLKNSGRRTCNFPRKGKYVHSSESERSCNSVGSTPSGGFNEFLDNTRAVPTARDCNFSCKSGYVKSASTYSCNKALTCVIANGQGQNRWNPRTSTYSATCEVVDCNAGYDSVADSAQCQPTASGFFSLVNDKTRTTCPTPANSSPTSTIRLSSAVGCYTCNSGYLKNTARNTCDVPSKGKYVNGGTESLCNPITIEGGATASWIRGIAATADACPFSCSAGFVKSGRACNIPGLGKYADNSGDEQVCNNPTGAAAGFDVFLPNMGAVDSATGCGFSCKSGFVKNTADRTCNIPDTGKYADSVGDEQSCNTPRGAATGFNTFLPNTAAVPTATGCDFSCNVGFVKKSVGRTCNIPDQGKYADNGVEKSCSPITGDTGGFNEFVVNTVAVSTATGCGFSCNTGFVKSGRTCNFPSTGSFVNAQGTEALCGPITLEGAATATWIAGAAAAANTCPFFCSSGYVKNSLGRECKYPSTGSYADAQGNEASCNSITLEGTAIATWQKGAASTDTDCQFSCSGGYVADSSARECNYPTPGTYADAQGAEVSCTDITGITGFGAWVSGAATDQDSCPFSCASGYTISGRTCNKSIPEMLALGLDTSYVLFSTGEVEAWGKVSDHTWRTHIKEDLGNNTPQALVSGHNHQCIILKNAALNHGSLMCWGQNDNGQLGVGDTIKKTTPTAVTVFGNDGDGDPYTVKSVTGGGSHTCALLNDDTVKCWGKNNNGQIGGGSSGSWHTVSGTTIGDPLSGGTASRIAAGEEHTCAVLTTDNSVQCWGDNSAGQTDGGTPSLGGGKTATEIALGYISSCAILNDSSVVCWGYVSSPLGSKAATGVAVGYEHACALLSDKTVNCWGMNNDYGQMGGGTAGSDRVLRGTVDDPLGGETAIKIAASYDHSCAIMESDNSVKCWGKNIDFNDTGFYGQIVGEVLMKGGSDGTGTSTGQSQVLTASSTPTATSLDSNEDGLICKITLSGGTLGSPWVAKNYTTPLMYNPTGSTAISDAIDTLIAVIGSPLNIAGTNVTLSKSGTDKIAATTDTAAFDGMTLTIFHDTDGGNCTTSPVGTPITLSGASGGAIATGLWVISNNFSGSGDTTVNLDSVHLSENSPLTKEGIADAIVTEVTGASWVGKQYKDLPYTATKLDGSSDANDDCPASDFCVLFERVFKGTEGNYGIPFGDRDYSH